VQSPWTYGTTAGQEAAQSEAPRLSTRRAANKIAAVNEAIVADGASLLYLPAYSPDFNPIEQFLAKLKALLRKAAARTKEALWQTAGQLLERVPSAECGNYLANAGYEPA
jgi:transposase